MHDTFHHHLAGETEFFPERTGIVHISGVVDPDVAVDDMLDPHRVLVDDADRLENVPQIRDARRRSASTARTASSRSRRRCTALADPGGGAPREHGDYVTERPGEARRQGENGAGLT